LKECLLHLSSKSYKEFPAFLTAIYKMVDNFDSHVCAPFICINTQIQKMSCRVPIESTPCHDRVAMVVTKFDRALSKIGVCTNKGAHTCELELLTIL